MVWMVGCSWLLGNNVRGIAFVAYRGCGPEGLGRAYLVWREEGRTEDRDVW